MMSVERERRDAISERRQDGIRGDPARRGRGGPPARPEEAIA
jgi:hypothetical protein